jgi:hypothetical protein
MFPDWSGAGFRYKILILDEALRRYNLTPDKVGAPFRAITLRLAIEANRRIGSA